MTRSKIMVCARTVLVLPLVTGVTNVYHTTLKHCYQLNIQTNAKVSCEICFFKNVREYENANCSFPNEVEPFIMY